MAAYPSLTIYDGFEQIPHDGRQIDDGADGLMRVRILHPDRFEFVVPHSKLSTADLATLRTFYTTNRALSFTFVSPEDGVTYTVAFVGRPKESTVNGNTGAVSILRQTA